jgi:hypothetical protein
MMIGREKFYECLRCRKQWKQERAEKEMRIKKQQELIACSTEVKGFYQQFLDV